MSQKAQRARPLSPHLQIYRWHPTMYVSIGHRMTGMMLAGGLMLLTWWLASLASGPEYFAFVDGIVGGPLGFLVLFVLTFALFFHAANGVRHLYWDTGRGLEPEAAEKSAIAVIGAAAVLTVLTWLLVLVSS